MVIVKVKHSDWRRLCSLYAGKTNRCTGKRFVTMCFGDGLEYNTRTVLLLLDSLRIKNAKRTFDFSGEGAKVVGVTCTTSESVGPDANDKGLTVLTEDGGEQKLAIECKSLFFFEMEGAIENTVLFF